MRNSGLFGGFVGAVMLVSMSLAASAAWAEGPCDDDVEKFCKDVEGGEGKVAYCLWKKRHQLSKKCARQVEKDKARATDANDACKDDVEKYCKDVEPGEGRVAACLITNKDKLSMACHQTVRVEQDSSMSFHKACKGDIKKLCAGVKPWKGRILACLNEKKSELSVDCNKAVERRK
jgi:hypothetical protein